jgi:hypothetical protein
MRHDVLKRAVEGCAARRGDRYKYIFLLRNVFQFISIHTSSNRKYLIIILRGSPHSVLNQRNINLNRFQDGHGYSRLSGLLARNWQRVWLSTVPRRRHRLCYTILPICLHAPIPSHTIQEMVARPLRCRCRR